MTQRQLFAVPRILRPALAARLRTKAFGGWYYTVLIWRTNQDLENYLRFMGVRDEVFAIAEGTLACVMTKTYPNTRRLGVACFSLDHLDQGRIAHEMVHAAWRISLKAWDGLYLTEDEMQESVATATGELVRDLEPKLKKVA